MGDKTAIEWCDATWTPIRARNKATGKLGHHCEHVSEGCRKCYAEKMNLRLGTGLAFKPGHRGDIEIFLDEKMLQVPLRWKKPRKIFVCSMTDLFADFVPDEWIDSVFAVMALCPQHTFMVLTKRARRMRDHLRALGDDLERINYAAQPFVDYRRDYPGVWPLPNVWLGVSVEDQAAANERIHELRFTPAAKRFVSAEPLLGPVDLTHLNDCGTVATDVLRGIRIEPQTGTAIDSEPRAPIDWVIVGGESGPGARPMPPDWARSLRDQCAAAEVPFFFKQWGAWHPFAAEDGGRYDGLITWPHDNTLAPGLRSKFAIQEAHGQFFARLGKKRAGARLDGREHREFPT